MHVLTAFAAIIFGAVVIFSRKGTARQSHAYMMAGSYVGLMAATFAEIAMRIPGWSFADAAIISSLVIIIAGIWMMKRLIPAVLNRGRGGSLRDK